MGKALRSLEDAVFAAGEGAPVSERRSEELVILAAEGEVSFAEASGETRAIPAGRALLVSAGSGLSFSLFNQSGKPARFIRAVFRPRFAGGRPRIELSKSASFQDNYLRQVATGRPGGAKKALRLNSDASLFIAGLTEGRVMDLKATAGGVIYVLEGKIEAGGKTLERKERAEFPGNGAVVRIRCVRRAKIVVIDCGA